MSTLPVDAVDPTRIRRPGRRRSSPTRSVIATARRTSRPPKKPIVKPLAGRQGEGRVVNGSGVKNAGGDALDAVHRGRVPVGGSGRRRRPQRLQDPGALRARASSARATPSRSPWERSNLVEARVGEEHARRRRARDRRPRLRLAEAPLRPHPARSTHRRPRRRPRRRSRRHDARRRPRRRSRTTTVDTRFVPVDPKTGGSAGRLSRRTTATPRAA